MDYARKHSRYGHRDSTMVLVTYRHGLRASEVCDLQWHQVELDQGRMHVRRAKNGTPSVHPIRGDEIRALRKLRRESPTEAYVFVTERGGPMSTIGFHHLIQRLGKAAKMAFPLHPHMLRHACGYKLANDGHDTRALQHYLGHKNIQHTVRYTELSPDRFRDFWRDAELARRHPVDSAHLQRARMCAADATPGRGGLLDSENCSCPLSQKPAQKRFLPQKGGSLSVEGVFEKKFSGAGEDFDRIDDPMLACDQE